MGHHPAFRPFAAIILFVLIAAFGAPGPAGAQVPVPEPAQGQPAAPPEPTPEQIDDLLTTLEDEQARTRLIEQLRLLRQAQEAVDEPAALETAGAAALSWLSEQLVTLGRQVQMIGTAFTGLPDLSAWARAQVTDPDARQRWAEILVNVAIILGGGMVGYVFVTLLLTGPRHGIARRAPERALARVPRLLLYTFVSLVPLVAFGLVAYGAISVVEAETRVRVPVLALVNATVITGAVMVLARAVLAPRAPALRVLPMTDATARHLYRWVRRIVIVAVFGYFVAEAAVLLGLSTGARNGLIALVGLVIAAMLILLVLQHRRHLRQSIRNVAPRAGRFAMLARQFGDIWHLLAIVYIIVLYGIWALDVPGGFGFMLRATAWSVVIILAAWLLGRGADFLVRRLRAISAEQAPRFPGIERRAGLYLQVLRRVLTVIITILAALGLLWAWGVPSFAWTETPIGRDLIGSVASIIFVLIIAAVAWEVVRAAVERQLAETDGNGQPVQRSARVRTLLPLLRSAMLVVLLTVVTLIVLSEMGINIAPLLAGAGVIGLAVGFGAQSMVKDVITGFFILFEDAISIGDVVNVAGQGGLVEDMSIRSVKLRDLSGNVYTIPFGEVTTVMNMTKEFSFYLLDIGVAYREDCDEVIEVVKQLGAEIQADPVFGAEILEPIEILGVDAFANSAVIIKARIKTKPIKQWMVGREFNRRMKRRFDELGIEIPYPHMTLYFGQDKQGAAPPANLSVQAPDLTEALSGRQPEAAPRGRGKARASRTPDRPGDASADGGSGS